MNESHVNFIRATYIIDVLYIRQHIDYETWHWLQQ